VDPLVRRSSPRERVRRLIADSEAVRAHLAALVAESEAVRAYLGELRWVRRIRAPLSRRRSPGAPTGAPPPVTDDAALEIVADLVRDERLC
jgi:anti-sigma factor RsiW